MAKKEYKDQIQLEGVATNNLQHVDVSFPIGDVSVVTGVSGSGKSSLVFDTLYAESYRRYVESLSSFARQYLKALPKPTIRHAHNLLPAIAVRQSRSGASNRSTVGTITEMYDLLRVIFTHLSVVICSKCELPVQRSNADSVVRELVYHHLGSKTLILAPLSHWQGISSKDLKNQLTEQGFTRVWLDNSVATLEEVAPIKLKKAYVILDRVAVTDEKIPRLREALNLGFKVGKGHVGVLLNQKDLQVYSSEFACVGCGELYIEPSMALLSFNHPLGACQTCQGFGQATEIDWDKVFPDKSLSLTTKGVVPWNFGQFGWFYRWAKADAKKQKIKVDKPFSEFTKKEWRWIKEGEVDARGNGSKKPDFDEDIFSGVSGFFQYLESKKYKAHYRIHAARFRKYVLCPVCQGQRLNEKAQACRIDGVNLPQACDMSIKHLYNWLELHLGRETGEQPSEWQKHNKSFNGTSNCTSDNVFSKSVGKSFNSPSQNRGLMGISEAIEEAFARLDYLCRIGVSYLSLDRTSKTLSGGELQRINMARCLGSALTDTLFCLDEPSSGLHARDSKNLLSVIRHLQAQGNTVVLVEHEQQLIQGADHLIEVGPKAGHLGGNIVFEGRPEHLLGSQRASDERVKGQAALATQVRQRGSTKRQPTAPAPADDIKNSEFLHLKGVRTHNLKDVSVQIPLGKITVVCGVSGSGKTSLIQHSLYPMVAKVLDQPLDKKYIATDGGVLAKSITPASVVKKHAEVMLVSQAALGRSSRSNIATYLGVMDEIRKLFASQVEAKRLKLTLGSFSFNTPGGRCETCRGLGTVTEDLSFLGDMDVICPTCNGKRFEEKVLGVTYKGKNLIEVLALTVEEAREFFFDKPNLIHILNIVADMGMGYISLGQNTSSFSGGEAQRLKLVELMRGVKGRKPSLLIFDEPTTGLSDWDVQNLLAQLHDLASRGHTIVIVEHHLHVIRSADWVIEIGPDAAELGGEVVYQGPPEGIKAAAKSLTKDYLAN